MFKQDKPVNVTAATLHYDGTLSKATYEGKAQLWQGETSIKADTIAIESKTGDLTATGSVVTTTMLEQTDQNEQEGARPDDGDGEGVQVQRSAARRATYTGDAQ